MSSTLHPAKEPALTEEERYLHYCKISIQQPPKTFKEWQYQNKLIADRIIALQKLHEG